jgi:hypothetical protein
MYSQSYWLAKTQKLSLPDESIIKIFNYLLKLDLKGYLWKVWVLSSIGKACLKFIYLRSEKLKIKKIRGHLQISRH